MEDELQLTDLADIGGDGFSLFAASDDELAALGGGNPKPEDKDKDETKDKPSDDKTGDKPKGQESVAKDKDEIQVQAGKTADAEKGSNSSSPQLNETEQLYSNLATKFKAEGVLPGLDDTSKIKTLKDLEDAIRSQVTLGLSDRQKSIEDAMNVGLPAKEVSDKMDVIANLEKIDDAYIDNADNSEFRMTAIAQDFIAKGYDKERAATMAQRSVDAGTDIEDAKFALKSIIAHEKKTLADTIESAKAKEDKSINDVKDYIDKNKEVIPGIKLTDAQSDELYKQITTDLGNKQNAFMVAQKKDPTGSRVKLETFFYLTKGFTDFSVFKNSAETDVSKDIENLLRGASFTDSGRVDTNSVDQNANFALKDLKNMTIE
jgi:hypothetical protein